MLESPAEVLARIQRGEDSFLELKEVVFAGDKLKGPDRKALADELAAFANSRGGHLVLGVRDATRDIVGIPSDRTQFVESLLAEIADQSIDPPLDLVTQHLSLPDATGTQQMVVHVFIPRSPFVHRSPSGYFRRRADSKRRMRTQELVRLFEQRSRAGFIGFDEQTVDAASFQDLGLDLVDRFRTERTNDDPETFAHKLGMVARTESGEELRPTIAGILFCTSNPERWLRHAFIQAVAYRGQGVADSADMVNYQLDARDITGPLDVQIAEACRFVTKNQRVSASKALGRADRPQYDMTSVFEAIVNAVAHRDYSIHQSKIRLRMFSDRLELYSPGGLPNTLELDMLPYRQVTRNDVIASRLAEVPVPSGIAGLNTTRATMMDRRGEGVRVLLRRSEAHSGRRPVYRLLDEAEVMLTIFAAA